eukprot:12930488-Prorocentrum_lima.AAC.1
MNSWRASMSTFGKGIVLWERPPCLCGKCKRKHTTPPPPFQPPPLPSYACAWYIHFLPLSIHVDRHSLPRNWFPSP